MKCTVLALLILVSGCSMPMYYVKQGLGQLSLQSRGISNDKVLKDENVSEDVKFKIRLVEDAKRFFGHYFDRKLGGIYSKTAFLDNRAVSWLVIASPPDDVEAHKFNFIFMGEFPYIGFFSKTDAEDFKKDLEEDEGLVTWMRPILAYSTLGYLEDRILSSFFEFDEVELVDLVFHELFHTIYFVKNEVELNENLASFFADKLLDEYFKDNPLLIKYRHDKAERDLLEKRLVHMALELRAEFAKMRPNLTAEKAREHAKRFVREILVPVIQVTCAKNGWVGDDCPDQEEKWNQARLAALLTYEEEQDFIKDMVKTEKLSLREFLAQLEKWSKEWEKKGHPKEFSAFLRKKLN